MEMNLISILSFYNLLGLLFKKLTLMKNRFFDRHDSQLHGPYQSPHVLASLNDGPTPLHLAKHKSSVYCSLHRVFIMKEVVIGITRISTPNNISKIDITNVLLGTSFYYFYNIVARKDHRR